MITTNQTISQYDFYDRNNIFILKDEKDIYNLDSFLSTSKYSEIDRNIYEKYSIDSWINTLLN